MTVLPSGPFGERVSRRLADDIAIWFTAVDEDGTPEPNPVWFLWDGADHLTVYNRPNARRLQYIGARPNVAFNLDGDGRGGDVVVLTGTAARDDSIPPAHENDEYVVKYGAQMEAVSGTLRDFTQDYPVPVRVRIRRIRGH
jgi:PPOX class probable F420-dependent enzyme